MRCAQGGGLTPRGQRVRERIRLEAGARFAQGGKTAVVDAEPRVGVRRVGKWRRSWREGGPDALRSAGPMSVERLSPAQWERLVREPARGPLAHGRDEGGGWTLVRVKTVIGRLLRVGCTVQGVWRLLRRHGWSLQIPAHRALERDDGAVGVRHEEVWPWVKDSRRTWAPSSASRTKRAGPETTRRSQPGTARADPGVPGTRRAPGLGVDLRRAVLPGRPATAPALPATAVARPQR